MFLEIDILTSEPRIPVLHEPLPKHAQHSVPWPLRPKNEHTPNNPRLDLTEALPQRPLEFKRIVFLIVENPVVRAAPSNERAECIIPCDALAQHICTSQHTVRRHALFEQRKDVALFFNWRGNAVQEVVHADRVEFLLKRKRFEHVSNHGICVRPLGADLRDSESSCFAVDKSKTSGRRNTGRVKVVARANADVEVVFADIGAKEWQEVGRGRTAPGVGVDEAEDPEIVDGETEGGIKLLVLVFEDFSDSRCAASFDAAHVAVGKMGGS